MQRFSITFSSILLILICSCKKDLLPKYTISGRLLESSSNPIPIKNYKLQVSQRDDFGLFGGVSGITKEFQTDGNGNFLITYIPSKSSGLIQGSINGFPLSITGIDRNIWSFLSFSIRK